MKNWYFFSLQERERRLKNNETHSVKSPACQSGIHLIRKATASKGKFIWPDDLEREYQAYIRRSQYRRSGLCSVPVDWWNGSFEADLEACYNQSQPCSDYAERSVEHCLGICLAYNPSSQSAVEKGVGSLKHLLKMGGSMNQLQIHELDFCLNNSIQPGQTGSPIARFLGRHTRKKWTKGENI